MVYADAVMGPTTSEPFAVPMEKKRKSLHLSFDSSVESSRQQPPRKRMALVSSPDSKNKLTTPTLERVLMRNVLDAGTPLLTPGTFDLMTTFNKTPTADQTDFVKGFEEKLAELTGQKNNYTCASDMKMEFSGDETSEIVCLNEPISHEVPEPTYTSFIVDGDNHISLASHLSAGSITAIPIYDEADIKSYTDLSYAHATADMTCVEIPTVAEAPPNSIPIVATKTASFGLTSGGKLLNINFDLNLPSESMMTATDSEPTFDSFSEVSNENIPTMVSEFNDDQSTMDSYDSDADFKPSTEGSNKKSSRKGNTRPIPRDLPVAEQKKLERKRERNRLAASKCRQRKMQRIDELEAQVKKLKTMNAELTKKSSKLAKETTGLKAIILEHVKAGCQIIVSSDFLITNRK